MIFTFYLIYKSQKCVIKNDDDTPFYSCPYFGVIEAPLIV